jgi:hypothetical protein
MATETNPIVVLKRVAPGDRWVFANATKSSLVYPSLTDALEAYYQVNGDTQYFIDARDGTVSVFEVKEYDEPVKTFSLYGED